MTPEIQVIHIQNTPPIKLFDDLQAEFYDRLSELSIGDLKSIKQHFIDKEWYEYLKNIDIEINKKSTEHF